NVITIFNLIKTIKLNFPKKKIWCYTGYTWEQIFNACQLDNIYYIYRQDAVKMVDILVDGRYIDKLRDLTLAFRGSSNQRVIDVKKSLETNSIILWEKN